MPHWRGIRSAATSAPRPEAFPNELLRIIRRNGSCSSGNTAAIERLLRPFVGRVVIANPSMVRAIAYAPVKTDKIDAVTLARLQASGFLPEVWAADEDTVRRRLQTTERMGPLDETVRL